MLAVTSCRRMLTYSCYPDDEGATFPWNIGSYKSHTA
jgi:hypothetical protein